MPAIGTTPANQRARARSGRKIVGSFSDEGRQANVLIGVGLTPFFDLAQACAGTER